MDDRAFFSVRGLEAPARLLARARRYRWFAVFLDGLGAKPAPYASVPTRRSARRFRPQAPRTGRRDKLLLLPLRRGAVAARRSPGDGPLHGLSWADLDSEPDARTRPAKLVPASADSVAARLRAPGLRVLQPRDTREEGSRMRDVPRASRLDGQRVRGADAGHGVVSRMSPRPGQVPPPARGGDRDGLRARGAAIRARRAHSSRARRESAHVLHGLSSLSGAA